MLPLTFSTRSRANRRRPITSKQTTSRGLGTDRCAETGHPRCRGVPGRTLQVAAIARLCNAHLFPGAAGRRHRLHRRLGPVTGGRCHLAGALEPHPGDRRGEPAGDRRAQRHHRRSAGRRRAGGPVLSARSRLAAHLCARRQRRGVRRRSAGLQVRHHQALRPGTGSGAADRGNHQDRRQDREERGRLRPDQLLVGSEGTLPSPPRSSCG